MTRVEATLLTATVGLVVWNIVLTAWVRHLSDLVDKLEQKEDNTGLLG